MGGEWDIHVWAAVMDGARTNGPMEVVAENAV